MSCEQDKGEKADAMCGQCGQYYGCVSKEGLCSSCYRQQQSVPEQKQAQVSLEGRSMPALDHDDEDCDYQQEMEESCVQAVVKGKGQEDRSRCYGCGRKVGLLGVECRCGYVFCNSHRLSQNHECSFDHRRQGTKELKKTLVLLQSKKIVRF